MVVQLSPGVVVSEQVAARTTPNSATVTAALVGAPVRGNVDEVVNISSLEALFQEYGYPTIGSNFHYSAIGYLLRGQALRCMRAAKSALYGGVEIKKNGSGEANAAFGTGKATPKTSYTFGTDGAIAIVAKDPGVWDNGLQVKTTHDDGVTSERLGTGDGSSKTFTGIFAKKPIRAGTVSVTDSVETFSDNGAGVLTGSAGGTGSYVASTGVWSVTFQNAPALNAKILGNYRESTSVNAFTITVYAIDVNGTYQQVEIFTGCSRKHGVDPYGRQRYVVDRVNNSSSYIYVIDNTVLADTNDVKEQLTALTLAGGSDGVAVTDSEITTAWDMFANKDEIAIRLMINGGYTSTAVQNKMIALAEARKDCMALLDMPYEITDVEDMVQYRKTTLNPNTSYATMFAHWLQIYDQWNDVLVDVPASGFVAGQFAYSDQVKAPWWPAAGTDRGRINAQGVVVVFDQDDRDELYQAQINPIQSFTGQGILIWGNTTLLSNPSPLQSTSIRRMLLAVEAGLTALLSGMTFTLNTEAVRATVKSQVDDFLSLVLAGQGLESYNTVCDETNNTAAVRAAKQLRIDITVVPTSPAENVQIMVYVSQTGVTVSESLAAVA